MAALPHPDLPSLRVLDELSAPVLLAGVGGDVGYANAAAAAWFGTSLRRLVGRPWLELLGGASGSIEPAIGRAFETRAPIQLRRLRFDAPGGDRFADLVATPLADSAPYALALELRPVNEFRELDAAQALPTALQEALKGLAHEVKN